MSDNLLSLISKLAYRIVNEEFNKKNVDSQKKNNERFEKCYERVRRKGCDALLGRSIVPPPPDPCITDYGGNWSPVTLISDYGRELIEHGAEKYNDILEKSVYCLLENEYDCANDLLKFLLLLKRPLTDSTLASINETNSDSEFFSMNSFSLLNEDISSVSSDGNSRSLCLKALKYEENWMKQFDPKFQYLGEYSRKNLLIPDAVSIESIFTAKPVLITSQSYSNSFVFTEFMSGKNYHSEKNIFHPKSSEVVNDTSLLDSFVDTPISHQLPDLSFILKPWPRNGVKSNEFGGKSNSLTNETDSKNSLKKIGTSSSGLVGSKPSNPAMSLIELKRTSNYSHSFSILYERVKNSQDLESDDSFLLIQDMSKSREGPSNPPQRNTSKQIILGLWEQEQLLITEFRPELAKSFPSLRMISTGDFVEDVKYLLTGINSSTFHFDVDSNCFTMHYGTCLEDVTPESLYNFSEEFIQAGNCYSKLSLHAVEIGKNNFDTCTTISQAFWKSIFDYLELHYTVVLEIPRTINLMSLKTCAREIGEMIVTVAEICKVFKPEERLPEGGQLLTYLINIAEKINKQCVRNLIFGVLQNCCTVYFMCILQTWMFKGHLDNQNNELFIDWKRQKVKIKSRTYYNSFYVDYERTPIFLRGFEENIFNCGKSIHFMKLFNLEDKFIQILEKGEYPKMRPCLTVEELDKLENDFKAYVAKVVETCGENVSVKTLREEEKEKERSYQEYVKECKKIQEKERKYLKELKLKNTKAEKDFKNKLLNQAWNLIETEKQRKRLEIEAEKKKFNEEMNAVAEMEKKMTDQAKSTLRKYYDGLLNAVEKKISLAELRKNSYLKILESPSSKNATETVQTDNELLDVINDNNVDFNLTEQVDEEGNLTTTLDVNLNQNLKIEKNEKTVKYDENSNPSSVDNVSMVTMLEPNGLTPASEEVEEPSKSVVNKEGLHKTYSHRTLAAEEAEKNKCKVMKSEFGLDVRKNFETKLKSKSSENEFRSELERNKRKVLESEYQILKGNSAWDIKPVKSQTELVKSSVLVPEAEVRKNSETSVPDTITSDAGDTEEDVNFRGYKLKRKSECIDLGHLSEQKSVETTKTESDSLISFMSKKDDVLDENVGGKTEVERGEPSTTVMKEEYKIALARDAEVFFHKLSQNDVFNNVEAEDSIIPCTDFTQLQRFLQKSALIPLRVQEKLANDALLSHLLKGENLLSHLESLRSYFFLNDGEFGRSFTHNTFRSLAKCTEPKQFFERSNLSNIVNEALNYTIHNAEPNSQNLSFQIIKMPPFLNHSFHDVLSPFELSYKVEWPLNIILTEKVLSKYKMVFKFLLKLKRINWTMNENFLFLNSYVKNKNFNSKVLIRSPDYHKIQIFRHAITEIMITLDDYIFSSGIQFPWIYFLKDLETTENIDDLYQKHVKYIKDVLTRCFLSKNSEDLLDCIHNLIETALKFHYTTKSSIFEEVNGKYVHPKFGVLKTTFNEFCSIIKTFLGILKEKIGANEVLRLHHVLIEKFDLKLA